MINISPILRLALSHLKSCSVQKKYQLIESCIRGLFKFSAINALENNTASLFLVLYSFFRSNISFSKFHLSKCGAVKNRGSSPDKITLYSSSSIFFLPAK